MDSQKLSDAEAKLILLKWPTRTSELWAPPGGRGYWIRGQPGWGLHPGPRLSAPGASLFHTQPDALWVYFRHIKSDRFCDVVAVEVCGTVQNLNDKRSRYIPANHSVMLECKKEWFEEKVKVHKGRQPRWKAAKTFKYAPKADRSYPIRHLRILYALPNDVYHTWSKEHVPTGYEFFCPHSSLQSYNSQKMQAFLRQMSIASQFYVKPQ
jgi:hypothetical protein